MKHILAALILGLLAACASSPPSSGTSTTVKADSVHTSPAECMGCRNNRQRIADCASRSGSCMGSCNKSDPAQSAMCQSVCQSGFNACMSTASVSNCPAYCGSR